MDTLIQYTLLLQLVHNTNKLNWIITGLDHLLLLYCIQLLYILQLYFQLRTQHYANSQPLFEFTGTCCKSSMKRNASFLIILCTCTEYALYLLVTKKKNQEKKKQKKEEELWVKRLNLLCSLCRFSFFPLYFPHSCFFYRTPSLPCLQAPNGELGAKYAESLPDSPLRCLLKSRHSADMKRRMDPAQPVSVHNDLHTVRFFRRGRRDAQTSFCTLDNARGWMDE